MSNATKEPAEKPAKKTPPAAPAPPDRVAEARAKTLRVILDDEQAQFIIDQMEGIRQFGELGRARMALGVISALIAADRARRPPPQPPARE